MGTQGRRSVIDEMATGVASRIRWRRIAQAATGYLFVAPAILIFLVYYAYAIGRSLYIGFTDYKMLGGGTATFVGFKNYDTALSDHWVIEGFGKAAYFMLLFYIGAFFFPLLVALVVDRVKNPRMNAVYRVLLFLPAAVPAPLVYRLWRWMYMPSFGLINYLLVDSLHLLSERPLWLVAPGLEIPSLVLMSWWGIMGMTTMFFLVGLDAIPPELYEAARLDGAGILQEVWYVALPLLKNTLVVWTILRIGAFGVVEPIMALWPFSYGAAPPGVWTWAYYSWFKGFRTGKMPLGYTAAIGWLGAVVMVTLALVARWAFREKRARG